MKNLVVIDLGSNSVRMTITEVDNHGNYQTVNQIKRYVRLSANMGPEKVLQPDAIDRTLAALSDFKDVYSQLEKPDIHAVATAAVRQASNQKAFLKQVKEQLGLSLKVISGATEARYDYLGVINTLPMVNGLIVDTGGGSSELILVQNQQLKHVVSIPLGSVTLSQNYLEADVVESASLFKAMTFVNNVFNDVWWLREATNLPIIGLGGANRTLAKINRRKKNFLNAEDVHGYKLTDEDVYETLTQLLGLDLEGRKKVPGLAKERADIIVGGLIPVTLLMRLLDSQQITFSNAGLRDGILFEYLNDLKA
ncbi:exopolyphosphatase [Levilactobacillus zymae]|uniref:exopolyphosphatase n=1 Tax=Levilactobacillus zymae TaxID=267363 RepID=A0A1Y6JV08_9LACO|nr:exopolyphosphatase [Levilactobacillus zymae]QFR61209.1 exopolyphosphatase [Levilactobacillus zymae]GEO72208.1 exopolyphosphatase [Levilactobacillus zymae]SMS13797.1 Exopolyphosphatase [Levilactobacillus zymae]